MLNSTQEKKKEVYEQIQEKHNSLEISTNLWQILFTKNIWFVYLQQKEKLENEVV